MGPRIPQPNQLTMRPTRIKGQEAASENSGKGCTSEEVADRNNRLAMADPGPSPARTS